jgi:cobalt-precorrin-6B (C15)-methyltransferase
MMNKFVYKGIGIDDTQFIKKSAPMTKQETRVISLSKLKIKSSDVVVDIGAGTGSVSIECAYLAKKVYAVEVKDSAISSINENIQKFERDNIAVLKGLAPSALDAVKTVDKIFIGGSKGNLEPIFDWLADKGKVTAVANFITLENATQCIALFKRFGYQNIDIVQAQISKGKKIGELTMMQAFNPVYIISASKQ